MRRPRAFDPQTEAGAPPPDDASRAGVFKHSLVVAGHRTSVSLERAFWEALKAAAAEDGCSLAALVARIDAARGEANLSSALRVFALERAQARGAARS
jgi:predicted DNA-binding ribbon-helix-helix protein